MTKLVFLFLISLLLLCNNSYSQIYGCTDPLATNYNPSATQNDGSCVYPSASVSPFTSVNLSGLLMETSGLILWNGSLWTHNDNTDTHLYCLDTLNGTIIQSYFLEDVQNIDWEEVSQDSCYVYIGDFGNNANGNRTDLKILRISKSSLLQNNPVIDTIAFSYSNQVSFLPTGANNTNFDCEAFIVSVDSIYLFTKQWLNNQTSLYALSKEPGTYIAGYRGSLNVNGLITGATYLEQDRLIVMTGYSTLLQPFLYLLYDFTGDLFFGGNKRKVSVSLPFHQVEGIATSNGLKYFITNEYFYQPPVINVPQGMHILDLSAYLGYYLQHNTTGIFSREGSHDCFVYPNLTRDVIHLVVGQDLLGSEYRIFMPSGKTAMRGKIRSEYTRISLKSLPSSMYVLAVIGKKVEYLKVVKR